MLLEQQLENEVEVTLIGELLMRPDIYIDIACQLMPNDFNVPECREIYDACIMLCSKDTPIDVLTILHEISRDEQHFKLFMVEARESAISTTHYKEHIRIIVENAKRRKAAAACRELLDNLTLSADMDICRENASELLSYFDGLQRDTATSAGEGYKQIIDSLATKKEYIETGIHSLDYFVKLRRGDFVGIGGRPSTGKTAFALQLMLSMSRKHNALFFSLETGKENIFERIVSNYASASYKSIVQGGMHQDDIDDIKQACSGYLDNLKFSVIEASGYTVEQIQSITLQKKADIVFIDYLQLLKSSTGKTLYEQVTNISKDLHTMAQRYKILVIALIQLNRATDNAQPDMKNLKDSGQVEQDIDCLLLLSTPNEDEEHNHIKRLKIAKNKKGVCGTLEFNFKGEMQKFYVFDDYHDKKELPFGSGKVHGEKDEQLRI